MIGVVASGRGEEASCIYRVLFKFSRYRMLLYARSCMVNGLTPEVADFMLCT